MSGFWRVPPFTAAEFEHTFDGREVEIGIDFGPPNDAVGLLEWAASTGRPIAVAFDIGARANYHGDVTVMVTDGGYELRAAGPLTNGGEK